MRAGTRPSDAPPPPRPPPASQPAKPPTHDTPTTTTTQTTTQTQSVKLQAWPTAADIKTGATVYDLNGGTVGTVESSDAVGVVMSPATLARKLGLSGFGVGDKGLSIAMTRPSSTRRPKRRDQAE